MTNLTIHHSYLPHNDAEASLALPAYAITKLTAADKKKLGELIAKAAG